MLEGRSLLSINYAPIDFHAFHNIRMQNFPQSEYQAFPEGNVTLGGVPFSIPAGGDNAWLGANAGGSYPRTIDIHVGQSNVTVVETLINTIYGWAGTHASLEFIGSEGAYYRKDLVSNSDIRDTYN